MLKYYINYIILKWMNLKLLSLNVNKNASFGLVVRVIKMRKNLNNLIRKKMIWLHFSTSNF